MATTNRGRLGSVRRTFAAAAAGLLVAPLLISSVNGAAHAGPPEPAGDVRPVPQRMVERPDGFPITPVVGLVRSEDADPAAEAVVRSTLKSAGVRRVVTSDGSDPHTPVTVWLGDGDDVLAELEVEDADDLTAEGYVIGAGRDEEDRGHVVIDGVDADGTFYGAQTFRQLVQARTGRDWFPGVEVRDWPTMKYRGLIEGFYGTPWSHQDRLDLMDYLGTHKMNTFEYAPKDDPYHRQRWRDPYPQGKLAELGELVDGASANHVDFTFALSPGLSICYTSQADFEALIAKFESLYELGTRSFNIPLDDIDYNDWHCQSDIERFGTGPAAAGKAQAYLLNRVQREWVEPKGDVGPLQMVPTEYYNASESPYKRELRERMDEDIVVMWTGIGVVPQAITVEQAQQAREVFGHEILVWDNYPVNDYAAGRLLLAPYTGREPGLSEPLVGIVSNPMNQAAMSEIALASFGDFGWHDTVYDARESWEAALLEVAAGDERTAGALETFADLNWFDGRLHHTQSPVLAQHIEDFWTAWESGARGEAIASLRDVVDRYAAAPQVIRDGVPDQRFLDEAAAWLDAAELWMQAMGRAVDLVEAQTDGDGDAAWAARQDAVAMTEQAKAIRPEKEPHSSTYPHVGDGVVDEFIDRTLAAHDRWVGVTRSGAEPTTTLGTYQDNVPARMVDKDTETFYWSNQAPRGGDAVGVDLGQPREIGDVEILMGKPSSPNDYIHDGTLEYSVDGDTWHSLASGTTAEVRTTAPEGTVARYVRYRSLTNSDYWLVVREFDVEVLDEDATTYTVTGEPPAAPGSRLQAAADGRLSTSYVAARPAAAGEALTVTASKTRPVDQVVVLQSSQSPVPATLQVRDSDGAWLDVGQVDDGYAEIHLDGVETDAFRLAWPDTTTAPEVAEIVPRYADVPIAALAVDPASLELERGQQTSLDVALTSTHGEDITGQLTVEAPEQWSVEPAETSVTVRRGEELTVDVAVTVPDDAQLGDATVRVSFAAAAESVDVTVPATVHLATTDENIAQGATATASSVEPNTTNEPAYAVDGDPDTRWSSAHDDDAWLQVELAEPARIGKVRLLWEDAYGEDYDLQVSEDGVTWSTAARVRDGDGGVDTVRVDATGRYFRMQGVDRATRWGYSLYEFELYPVQ